MVNLLLKRKVKLNLVRKAKAKSELKLGFWLGLGIGLRRKPTRKAILGGARASLGAYDILDIETQLKRKECT